MQITPILVFNAVVLVFFVLAFFYQFVYIFVVLRYREVPVVLGELPDEDGEEDHGWCDFDNAW